MENENTKQLLRIVDADLNRIGEGLRFLEEIARFLLNDASLSARIKELRHRLSVRDFNTKLELLSARDSQNDVGENITTVFQKTKHGLHEAVIAGARRVEESLRVLEEISKIDGMMLETHVYPDTRFTLYTVEKELLGKLTRKELSTKICGLYAVVDTDCLRGKDAFAVTAQILAGGARLVQLRDKKSNKQELLHMAVNIKKICDGNDALLIINDYLDIALASGADGLHLGQTDLPVQTARRLMPVDKLIGCSIANIDEAKEAAENGADYLGYGAVFPTPTKPECPVMGIEGLKKIKENVSLPLVAIGGINHGNIEKVFDAGADAAAVISAILLSESPEDAVKQIIERIDACHEQID